MKQAGMAGVCVLLAVMLMTGCAGNRTDTQSGENEHAGRQPLLETGEQMTEAALEIRENWELAQRLYDGKKEAADAQDFTGEWSRTGEHTGEGAWLTITQQDGEGFWFELECQYFFHLGYAEGKAYLISPQAAIYQHVDEFAKDGENVTEYVTFVIRDGELTVTSATGIDTNLGFGNRVLADGRYVQGEPVYTNAGQFETYFAGAAEDFMRNALSESAYEELFFLPADEGYLSAQQVVLADGRRAKALEVYVPTSSYGFWMILAEDGMIYTELQPDAGFLTNDGNAQQMPELTAAE